MLGPTPLKGYPMTLSLSALASQFITDQTPLSGPPPRQSGAGSPASVDAPTADSTFLAIFTRSGSLPPAPPAAAPPAPPGTSPDQLGPAALSGDGRQDDTQDPHISAALPDTPADLIPVPFWATPPEPSAAVAPSPDHPVAAPDPTDPRIGKNVSNIAENAEIPRPPAPTSDQPLDGPDPLLLAPLPVTAPHLPLPDAAPPFTADLPPDTAPATAATGPDDASRHPPDDPDLPLRPTVASSGPIPLATPDTDTPARPDRPFDQPPALLKEAPKLQPDAAGQAPIPAQDPAVAPSPAQPGLAPAASAAGGTPPAPALPRLTAEAAPARAEDGPVPASPPTAAPSAPAAGPSRDAATAATERIAAQAIPAWQASSEHLPDLAATLGRLPLAPPPARTTAPYPPISAPAASGAPPYPTAATRGALWHHPQTAPAPAAFVAAIIATAPSLSRPLAIASRGDGLLPGLPNPVPLAPPILSAAPAQAPASATPPPGDGPLLSRVMAGLPADPVPPAPPIPSAAPAQAPASTTPPQGDGPLLSRVVAGLPPHSAPPSDLALARHPALTTPPLGGNALPSPATASHPPTQTSHTVVAAVPHPILTAMPQGDGVPATAPPVTATEVSRHPAVPALPIPARPTETATTAPARMAKPIQTMALLQILPDMPLPIPARSDGSAGLPPPAAPSAQPLPPTPLPDLVARQILPSLGSTGPVTVTLAPVELGTLVFEVSQRADGLHLHLTVDTPETLDLLRRQADQILAELRQAGFANASLSFAGQDGQPGTHPGQEQAGNDRPPGPAPEPSPEPAGLPPIRSRTAAPGTLDLRL